MSTRVIMHPAHNGRAKHIGALLKEVLTYSKGCKVCSKSHFPKLQLSNAIFPSYNFPKYAISKAETFQVCPNRSDWPPSTLLLAAALGPLLQPAASQRA